MIRLQGKEWHDKKHTLKLVEVQVSTNGNIKGTYRDWQRRKMYTHWFNSEEKEEYINNKVFQEIKTDGIL